MKHWTCKIKNKKMFPQPLLMYNRTCSAISNPKTRHWFKIKFNVFNQDRCYAEKNVDRVCDIVGLMENEIHFIGKIIEKLHVIFFPYLVNFETKLDDGFLSSITPVLLLQRKSTRRFQYIVACLVCQKFNISSFTWYENRGGEENER